MNLLCFLRFHYFGSWYRIQEVPIWHRTYCNVTCVGNQPVKEQLYTSGTGTIKRIEPDVDFRLVGKVVEQRRTCLRAGCHYTHVQFKKWKV